VGYRRKHPREKKKKMGCDERDKRKQLELKHWEERRKDMKSW